MFKWDVTIENRYINQTLQDERKGPFPVFMGPEYSLLPYSMDEKHVALRRFDLHKIHLEGRLGRLGLRVYLGAYFCSDDPFSGFDLASFSYYHR